MHGKRRRYPCTDLHACLYRKRILLKLRLHTKTAIFKPQFQRNIFHNVYGHAARNICIQLHDKISDTGNRNPHQFKHRRDSCAFHHANINTAAKINFGIHSDMRSSFPQIYTAVFFYIADFTANLCFCPASQIDGGTVQRIVRYCLNCADFLLSYLLKRIILCSVLPFLLFTAAYNIMQFNLVTVCLYSGKVNLCTALKINLFKCFCHRNGFIIHNRSLLRRSCFYNFKNSRESLQLYSVLISHRQLCLTVVKNQLILLRQCNLYSSLCQVGHTVGKSISIGVRRIFLFRLQHALCIRKYCCLFC